MNSNNHIPYVKSINEFYDLFGIGIPYSNQFTILPIENQPETVRLFMPLYRSNFYKLALFTSPGVQFILPEKNIESSANSMYIVHPGQLESWKRVKRLSGFMICFTADFLQIDELHSSYDIDYPFFNFNSETLIRFSENETNDLKQTANAIWLEINSDNEDKYEMIKVLLKSYLIKVKRIYNSIVEAVPEKLKNDKVIFNKFRKSVDEYFIRLNNNLEKRPPSVTSIATEMNITANYLNKIIKTLTGKSAIEFLQDKTMLEAKSYLMHTDLQVSEIAYKLGFDNVPYFIRYFKKQAGSSPKIFRNSI